MNERTDLPVRAVGAACRRPQAGRIGELWWLIVGISAAVYLLVMVALALALPRRRGPGVEPVAHPDEAR